MALASLSSSELALLKSCLDCVAEGNVILHDWEFHTIMGVTSGEFLDIHSNWPDIDESDEKVFMAINNSIANIIGYPHKAHNGWDEYFDFSKSDVVAVFNKWKGQESSSYFEALE